ncbi:hypothetical protein BKA62DRAFT_717703 [Auriculariales sp. MPI-PUGE-AT-0066]|nr:hypothetical protein BKA62DRAFT_717703 [Auriculariales sp. MPI-PUGE-AT-0066]
MCEILARHRRLSPKPSLDSLDGRATPRLAPAPPYHHRRSRLSIQLITFIFFPACAGSRRRARRSRRLPARRPPPPPNRGIDLVLLVSAGCAGSRRRGRRSDAVRYVDHRRRRLAAWISSYEWRQPADHFSTPSRTSKTCCTFRSTPRFLSQCL